MEGARGHRHWSHRPRGQTGLRRAWAGELPISRTLASVAGKRGVSPKVPKFHDSTKRVSLLEVRGRCGGSCDVDGGGSNAGGGFRMLAAWRDRTVTLGQLLPRDMKRRICMLRACRALGRCWAEADGGSDVSRMFRRRGG